MLRILTYHRVADPGATMHLNPRMISATPEVFAHQMRFIARHYHAVSMAEVLAALQQAVPLPRGAVLLTFDDAYCDFGEIAWPILKGHQLPATLFVPTGYPDFPERAFWWDRLHRAFQELRHEEIQIAPLGALACGNVAQRRQSLKRAQDYVKTLPHAEAMRWVEDLCAALGSAAVVKKTVLSWDELRRLMQEGVTLGAHTVNHPMMTRLSHEDIRHEVTQAQADLRRELGKVLPIFCYPSGGHDDAVVSILREAGMQVAFTTRDGQNDLGSADPLRLRRTNITPRTTPLLFRLRLTKFMSHVDAWRHREK